MTTRNGAFVSALVEALARSGVEHACVAPGSRNTPLSLAFAAHPAISDWSHHDERSAGFFAVGLAKTTARPVAIVTTSGTAAAELTAALAEASASRVPVIALTADRPTELWDVGAAQTIDQRHLFSTFLKWQHDLDVPHEEDAGSRTVAALGVRLVAEAIGIPPGPVHLNVRFREPLLVDPDFSDIPVPELVSGSPAADPVALESLAQGLSGRDGVIVAGPQHDPEVTRAAQRLAREAGWPILSDPVSGMRSGAAPATTVGSDLLAATGYVERAGSEAVVRIGGPPTSKALRRWLAAIDVPQVLVDPAGWRDPDSGATQVVRASAAGVLDSLADHPASSDRQWIEQWLDADDRASRAAQEAMSAATFPNEPAVASALQSAPDGCAIWTAASMPVRDVDSWFPVTQRPVRLLGNRGANGIDGFISSALGCAATGTPTIAHAGDLSALHDLTALATAVRLDLPITVVVVNNDGGGIFHFLPQEGHPHFERHFGTPHGLSFVEVAMSLGMDAVRADDTATLEQVIAATGERPRLVEVVTSRAANVTIHREILATVEDALALR